MMPVDQGSALVGGGSAVEVQEGRHPETPVPEEAHVPGLLDGHDPAAGMVRQPSLRRLDRGVEGRLDSKVGVDILDAHPLAPLKLLGRRHRQDGGAGLDTLDTAGGELDLDRCPRGRAGLLQTK